MTLLLATATGAIAANVYYAQPLLEAIARSVGTSAGAAGRIVTVTQLGFALGLLFVLPLADIVERRSLLTVLLLLDAAALAAVGLAPGPAIALVAFATLGLANVAAQVLVPAAAHLADDTQRGRTVASVISGLLAGMLLARTVAGIVTELVGWRPLFLGAAGLMIVVNLVLRRALRGMDVRSGPGLGYGEILRSTVRIYQPTPWYASAPPTAPWASPRSASSGRRPPFNSVGVRSATRPPSSACSDSWAPPARWRRISPVASGGTPIPCPPVSPSPSSPSPSPCCW
jgi:MFS family permease